MYIEYLKGPMKGTTEAIISETEDSGTPIYITESGKELSSVELNKTFRFKSRMSDVNLSDLGDPSLVEVEGDFRSKKVDKSDLEKPKSEVPFAEQLAQKNKKKLEERMGKPNTETVHQPQQSSNNVLLNQLFGNAKKGNKKINVSFNITAPTKDFYNLIMNAIEFSDDEFVDKVFSEIDMESIHSVIKEEIKNIYVEKTVAKKKPRRNPTKNEEKNTEETKED